jgi:hypothetical protein
LRDREGQYRLLEFTARAERRSDVEGCGFDRRELLGFFEQGMTLKHLAACVKRCAEQQEQLEAIQFIPLSFSGSPCNST